jgi:hypothetical protein
MDTIKKKLQYTKNMDDNRRIHAQPIYYYKATKELMKLASGRIQSYNKKKIYTQKLTMITEEVMHNQRITYNRVS